MRIGLTGGIASGKSTVANLFVARGAGLIDTDLIARELVVPGAPAFEEILDRFGEEVVADDGTLDRRKLREIVFADTSKRHLLEQILHPRIRARTLELVAAERAAYVLIAVPLLVETGFSELVDRVLVVDCPESQQIERLVERDGVSAEQAQAMLAAQTDRSTRLAAADDIVDNGGDLAATEAQVAALHEKYLALIHDC